MSSMRLMCHQSNHCCLFFLAKVKCIRCIRLNEMLKLVLDASLAFFSIRSIYSGCTFLRTISQPFPFHSILFMGRRWHCIGISVKMTRIENKTSEMKTLTFKIEIAERTTHKLACIVFCDEHRFHFTWPSASLMCRGFLFDFPVSLSSTLALHACFFFLFLFWCISKCVRVFFLVSFVPIPIQFFLFKCSIVVAVAAVTATVADTL